MTIRSNGPAAGFGWLSRGVGMAFRHPRIMFGGAAVLVLAALLPSLITLPMRLHSMATGTTHSPVAFGWVMAVSMLFGLLLAPLYGGYLQMIDAAERNLPARALDIFKPYRSFDAIRFIGYRLLILAIYAALFGTIIATLGRGLVSWYMQLLTTQANHQLPPALPHGFGVVVALFVLLAFVLMGFYAIGLGQIALRGRSVFGACRDGMIGAAKNLLPLLVFALSYAVALIGVFIVVFLVVFVIALLAKLVGMWLLIVLMIPLYIVLFLMIFAMMFGVMYCQWRDVCGDNTVINTPPPPPSFAA